MPTIGSKTVLMGHLSKLNNRVYGRGKLTVLGHVVEQVRCAAAVPVPADFGPDPDVRVVGVVQAGRDGLYCSGVPDGSERIAAGQTAVPQAASRVPWSSTNMSYRRPAFQWSLRL